MNILKKTAYILLAFTLLISFFPNMKLNVEVSANENELNIVDAQATDNTKALFSYFQDISGEQVLFGQQHATDEGLTLTNEAPRTASEQSEILNAVGDYPAIFGWDTLSIDGDEKPGVEGDVEQSIQNLAASMEKAHELGGLVTLSMHPDNFATDGRYNDTTGNTVAKILPGGPHHGDFNAWLDNIAKLADSVKDENGEAIPIIFRPFHEQTGGWFWWGAHQTTSAEYKAIFRYTVEYLRDTKDVHNILYGFSPGAGPAGDLERYLETYPGDAYVDIFGIDNYDDKNNAGSEEWLNGLVTDLAMLVDLAEERGKIAALTEYGYSAEGMKETGNTLDWHTRVLNAIKEDPEASKIAYMQTWANFGWPTNMFVPYKDVNGDLGGDHELLLDFQAFKDDSYSAFREDVQGNIYTAEHKNKTVASKEPVAHVASPVSGTTITDHTQKLRVRVLHDNPQQVTYTVEDSDQEYHLTLDPDSNYYVGEWLPTAEHNGNATNLTFKVVHEDGTTYEETVKVFVKAESLPYKTYTFDDNIDGIKTNGTFPEAETVTFEHAMLAEDGKLKFQTSGMDTEETWQELKFELTDVTAEVLQAVNQIEIEALLPTSVGDGSIQALSMLPPDWETKHGMDETTKNISELEEVTIDGESFKKYHTKINLGSTADAESIAISLVGNQLNLADAIYIDNIKLNNAFIEAPADPLLVDNFEGYLGDDTLLRNAYSSNGDKVTLTHSSEEKSAGEYGLSYQFTIAGQGYAGRQTSLASLDWSETNAFQFWLKNDAYPNELTIQIQIGGVSFEAYRELDESFEGLVTIPFSEFTTAPWENKPDVTIDKGKLQNVSQFAIYTGGDQGEGTLYFDEMRAVQDDEAPEVPDEAESPDEEERNPVLFDFEDGEVNWSISTNNAEEPSINENGINGSSLQTTLDLAAGENVTISTTTITDLSDEETLSAKVHLSEGQAQAKFFVKTGDDWLWSDSGEIDLNSGDVTTLSLDLTTIENLDDVRELGIEFIPVEGETTATILIDDVALTDGSTSPEPEDHEVIDNKDALTTDGDNYLFELTNPKIEITKETISELDNDSSIQLTFNNTTATIPVNLLKSYEESITFDFGEVSNEIKEKRNDALSDMYDFRLFAGGEEITSFDQPITLSFTLKEDKEFNSDNLYVILVDENGELVVDERSKVEWNEETNSARAEISHFSIYSVFEYEVTLDDLENIVDDLLDRVNDLEEDSSVKDESIADLEQKLENVQNDYKALEENNTQLEQLIEQLQGEIADLKAAQDDNNGNDEEPQDTGDINGEDPENEGNNEEDSEGTDEDNNIASSNDDSESGESLPDTATNTFNWLIAGGLLTLAGLFAFILSTRRKA